MSTYNHYEAGDQSMAYVVNPSLTYHQASAQHFNQPFNQPQPAAQSFAQAQASDHSSRHSSTPMSAEASTIEATYPAGPVSGYPTYHAGDSMNHQVAYGQHYSAEAETPATNTNNFEQHYSSAQLPNANLRTINAAREILASPAASNDLYSNHGSIAHHGSMTQPGFTQNNTLPGQQVDFQALVNMHTMNNMNNMNYYPQQHMFMPQFPFNMMPIQYGQHYNMYGQVYNTPSLPVMEPPIQAMMGPPSTIVSSVDNWRHRISSPVSESHTTGTSGHQKISPQTGFDTTFNPAVLATYHTMPTSEIDDGFAANSSPVDIKPAMKKKKKPYSKTRSCFVCTGINNADMVNCAHPDHQGTRLFHLDCAGLASKTDNGGSWYCNSCLNSDNVPQPHDQDQDRDRFSAPPLSPLPESDHSSYHPSPQKKKLLRKSRRTYTAPTGVNLVGDLFTPYSAKPAKPYQPPAYATRRTFSTPALDTPHTSPAANPYGRGLTSHGGWTAAEDTACISIMTNLINRRASDELKIPIDKMWELAASRMARAGFSRTASGIKMQWTRRLRAVTGLDERKVPNAAMMRTGLIMRRSKKKHADDESDHNAAVMPRGRRSGTVAPRGKPTASASASASGTPTFVSAGKSGVLSGRVTKNSVAASTPTTSSPALGGRGKRGKKVAGPSAKRAARVDEGIAMIVDRPFTTMMRDTAVYVTQKQ